MQLVGIVGKANTGKSTLFSALTLAPAEIGNYPFTTTKPNRGVTYLTIPCVCKELGVQDSPKNSICADGLRMVPIEVIDCPGIIRGAHKGRGLGLQFLDDIRQADALIVVCDASGGTDGDGNPVEAGTHDPVLDVGMVEQEVALWIREILRKDWSRIIRGSEAKQADLVREVAEKLSGLGVELDHVSVAISSSGLDKKMPGIWSEDDLVGFCSKVRELSKPIVVAANKIDVEGSARNFEKLKGAGYDVEACSAEAERTLRLASSKGLIKYALGSRDFKVLDEGRLSKTQLDALSKIEDRILMKWGSTGVQKLVNRAYLEILRYLPVFPVEDHEKLTDHDGNVLPDVYLVPEGTTMRELAYNIHSDLGENFLYAVDARTKMRLGENQKVATRQVIKIVSVK